MKKYISLFCIAALSFIACNKGQVDTSPAGISTGNAGLTYQQINGVYRIFDSIHFIGNQGWYLIDKKNSHPVNHDMQVLIGQQAYGAAFDFRGKTYVESKGVMNEYMTGDAYYDINRIWFHQDSVYINLFRREYTFDSSLSITLRGYKIY